MISKVLISGAGIAGPTLAFWLNRAGIETTIVERAPSVPTAGQQIDIRGPAREVIKRMGLEDVIRSKTTDERGLAFIDSTGKTRAAYGVDASGGDSFSSDIEILRGDLASIFYEATKDTTEYKFGDTIAELHQSNDGVEVHFASGASQRFDLVIAADGMRSTTRKITFDSDDSLKHLGMYTCYFTIPANDTDGEWAKWYNAPGRRCILARPDGHGSLRTYLSVMSGAAAHYHELDTNGQKRLMREIFSDAGWESERILDSMDAATDFYMQDIAQVKMPSWSRDRVALLGDAAYCPSPISGMGTSVAMEGAYVLAGEIARHRDNEDHTKGLQAYERKMRPRIEKAQELPPGAPALANPQTSWGISVMLFVLGLASWLGVATWFSGGPAAADEAQFEEYEF
ncbi:hypothetical protein AAFC00_001029 [Neodothiora populina]|uniref:FAD-binding domain-containing protein n=1 Tax=Neodothiora populina TaxID=2781224 RepID=A0ABR3PMJ8_9PEZI